MGARARMASLAWHLAAAGLFAAAAATVVWQNRRVVMLFDLSYILENAWRIAAGDVPYRDFPLAHAPGTFLVQALIIKLFDSSFRAHVVYCALVGGASAVVTLKILELQLEPHFSAWRGLALAMATPLAVLNVYAIYPHPFYDSDTCFLVLLALWAVLASRRRDYPPLRCFVAGALLVIPAFVKQNVGVVFFGLTHLALLSLWLEGPGRARAGWGWMIAGSVVGGVTMLLLIQATAGLDHYWQWTVTYAASRRLHPRIIVTGYGDAAIWRYVALSLFGFVLARHAAQRRGVLVAAVALTALMPLFILAKALMPRIAAGLPEAHLVGFWLYVCALSIPVVVLVLGTTPLRFPLLLPLVLVGTVAASFISQGAAGSTYGIFPLLVVLQSFLVVAFLPPAPSRSTWAPSALGVVVAVSLTAAGYRYVASNARLHYAAVFGSTVHASTHPRLRGMATSGEYLPDLDRLLAWADANIPPSEPVMTIPGEDPFFYALRRRPRMPVLLLERGTLTPFRDPELVSMVDELGIRWVIHKTELQCCSILAPVEGLMRLLGPSLELVHEIGPYRIYRRISRDT